MNKNAHVLGAVIEPSQSLRTEYRQQGHSNTTLKNTEIKAEEKTKGKALRSRPKYSWLKGMANFRQIGETLVMFILAYGSLFRTIFSSFSPNLLASRETEGAERIEF